MKMIWIMACMLIAVQTRAAELAPGVRGIATRAPNGMKIDGDLSEWKEAFSTPVEYFNADLKNRAGQFFYMWDDEAFYAALRTLDQKPADNAGDNQLWEGDAVEWYFDTRRDENFRGKDWGKGAVHCYWTGLTKTNVQPRFCLRPGYLDAIPKIGVQVGARRTSEGMEVEFKLPWANFPNFKPKVDEVIALDAELCYSDGAGRVFRSFVYGNPLSVQQPASQAKIQLVEKFESNFWAICGPVMSPIRADVPWTQKEKGMTTAYMALPPTHAEIGRIAFRLYDTTGKLILEKTAEVETFSSDGTFKRASASWPIDAAAPGTFYLLGLVTDSSGKELARIAPRMVSVNMISGY